MTYFIKEKKILLILFTIFLFGALLRFYNLGSAPDGFHKDEAMLGYNAYSILKTGRDISNAFLPLNFRPFIYSPAGYAYLSIPFIAIFGLSEFSTRFSSAFFGSLTIILIYFLTKEIFNLDRDLFQNKEIEIIALLSSFVLAFSPWHINLSRTATENVLAVFFITLGSILYFTWIRKEKFFLLFFSFIFFAVTFLIYQAPRAFLPIFIPILIILFRPGKNSKKSLGSLLFLFAFFIIIPLFLILSSKNLSLRIRTVSVFASPETQLTIDESIREDGMSKSNLLIVRLFHNKLFGYTTQIIKNYFAHFSYDFFFTDNSLPMRYKIPGMGILYIYDLPFLMIGAWFLLKYLKRTGVLLLAWFFLGPIGSALTFDDVPNLQRTLLIFPVLTIILAVGIYIFFTFLLRKFDKKVFYLILLLTIFIVLYSFLFYLHQYYIHGLKHRPWYRQEGYRELVKKVNQLLPNFKQAVITDSESAPAIFFLFYGKYSPKEFQNETNNFFVQDFDRVNFNKYIFTQLECPVDDKIENYVFNKEKKNILFVDHGNCKITEDNKKEIYNIKRSDDSIVFKITKFIY